MRLPAYDYRSQSRYYVTICTHERRHLFGDVVNDKMDLSPWGRLAQTAWTDTPAVRPYVELGAYVVMPNHFHALFTLWTGVATGPDYAQEFRRAPRSLGSVVAGFKQAVTRALREAAGDARLEVWQRGYHEHVVRNDLEEEEIHAYIEGNPVTWALDRENRQYRPRPGERRDGWRETM